MMMMLKQVSRLSSFISSMALLSSASVFAAPPSRPTSSSFQETELAEKLPETTKTEEVASNTSESTANSSETPSEPTPAMAKTLSDGSVVQITDLGMQITPPVGWEVVTNSGSVSLILQEPKGPVEYDKTMYQRNITVAAAHKASPIDEKRADDLKKQLEGSFGKDGLVSEFQVMEHKFFDYRGKNDGLLVYSSMKIGEEPMMQMHILVSGGEKQFLLTYTDLASRFSDQSDKGFETAWNSMVSIEVSGETPSRIEGYYSYFIALGIFALLALVLYLLRRKAANKDFDREANALEEEGYSHSARGNTKKSSDHETGSFFETLGGDWDESSSSEKKPQSKGKNKAVSQAPVSYSSFNVSSF